MTQSEGAAPKIVRGSCLCSAVRFEIDGRMSAIGHCHCSKCRKVSGTGSNAMLMTSRKRLTFLAGEELIRSFRQPSGFTSSFCERCGSPVPHLHPNGKVYWVPVGLLDDDPGVRVALHIYVASKAPWDEIAGNAVQHAEDWPDRPQ